MTYPAPTTGVVAPTHENAGRIRPRDLAAPASPELDAALAGMAGRCACRPAVAAALWWKQYSWFVVAAALDGWAASELPDLGADTACVQLGEDRPLVTVRPERIVAVGEFEPVPFARWLRVEVMTAHLAPILERLHVRSRAGRRLLWGSVAHAIALPLSRRFGDPVADVPRFLALVGGPVVDLVEIAPVDSGRVDSAGVDAGAPGGVRVSRRTCCLAFRSRCGGGDEPTLCGYCPVTRQRPDGIG